MLDMKTPPCRFCVPSYLPPYLLFQTLVQCDSFHHPPCQSPSICYTWEATYCLPPILSHSFSSFLLSSLKRRPQSALLPRPRIWLRLLRNGFQDYQQFPIRFSRLTDAPLVLVCNDFWTIFGLRICLWLCVFLHVSLSPSLNSHACAQMTLVWCNNWS